MNICGANNKKNLKKHNITFVSSILDKLCVLLQKAQEAMTCSVLYLHKSPADTTGISSS